MWIISVAIVLFLSIRTLTLSDTVRKHERWIKKLNKEIKLLRELMEESVVESSIEDSNKTIAEESTINESTSNQVTTNQAEKNETEADMDVTKAGRSSNIDSTSDLISASVSSKSSTTKTDKTVRQSKRKPKAPMFDMSKITIESIISKLGIGLVLVGLGFLFKYAYDRGMITEQLTVIIGYIIGLILYSLGYFVKRKNRELLSQVLVGGSIAAFYITTYAAHLAYGMLGQGLAFGILCIITVWAFLSSVYLKAQSVSVVAVIGGLIVPFVTKLDFIGLSGIGIYIGLVSLGAMTIHFFHRWRILQISTIVSVYVSIYLMASQHSMSSSESFLLFGLIMYLLIVQSVPDVLNFLGGRIEQKDNDISIFVLGSVPVVSVAFTEYFELATSGVQAIVFGLTAILYGAIFLMSERKGLVGNTKIVLASLSGLFAAYSVILYFDGVTRPVIVLSIGLLFYYGNTKIGTKFLPWIGHAISVIGLGLGFNEVILAFDSGAVFGDYFGHSLAVVILVIGAILQQGISKKIAGSIALQIYGFAVIELFIKYELPKDYFVLGSMFAFGLWMIALQVIKEKLQIIPRYGLEIYSLLMLLSKVLLAFVSVIEFEIEGSESIAVVVVALIIYGLAQFRYIDDKSRGVFKAVAVATLILTAVVDIWIFTDFIQYGVVVAGIIVLLYKLIDKDKGKVSELAKNVASYVWFVLVLISSWIGLDSDLFSIMVLLVSIGQLVIFYKLLSSMKHDIQIEFIGYSLVFFIVSYSALIGLNNADGSITLTWAAYSVVRLAYHMMKGQKQMAFYALGLIVFVVGKYIVVDISTVSVIWKVVTSMVFGVALLLLSYMIQPLIDRFNKE